MKWNKCSPRCIYLFSRKDAKTQSFGAFCVFAPWREHSFSKLNDSNLTYERKLDIVTTCFRSDSGNCK